MANLQVVCRDLIPIAPAILPSFGATTLADNKLVAGGNLLGRWTRTFSDDSDLRLQSYWDHTIRDTAVFREKRDTTFTNRWPDQQ